MSSPSPKSPELSDHSKKYDRQIRLWGEHGQNSLERANICLVNATAVGCEVIKNLILPGIGSFTIIDPSIVTEEDLGIGASKSECCMRLLQELNPDVNGDYLDESIDSLVETRSEYFQSFDVVTEVNSKSPWVHVIYKHLEEWKNETTTYKEKNEEEENHEEAIKAVNTVFECGGKISSNLSAIFSDEACQKLNTKWVIAKSMQDFIKTENNDLVPFPGTVPDMTADTDSYIKLQNIYRQKALQDAENVYQRC
uniref:THIF-type NAD/FAD binding fold domain-containing protein n=1 Tax=Megaselia scalaris TaxID=36166 RepID=T1H6I6_MEGSC